MKRVLVIDDTEDIRKSVKMILEHEHFEVAEASHGAEGLAEIKKKKPDLILLDLKMPGMTTKEIVDAFEKMKLDVPVVLFSASNPFETKESLKEMLSDGYFITDYIEKPFENKDFVKRIKKALARD